jgi:4-hydroxy-2-oxoheptanedioate aldolase
LNDKISLTVLPDGPTEHFGTQRMMRKSKTLARIRNGGVARICNLGHYIPSYVAHAARAGYDCIWIDMEHRVWDPREIQALLMQCHLHDIDGLVRPPTREKAQLYRYLEDGATGLMIPHVSTVKEAMQLVQSTRFPPLGERGLDNAGLDSDYAVSSDHVAYSREANRETFLTVQIETPEAVANSSRIAAIEGVDVLFVGPGDLGLRLKLAGDSDGSQLESAFETVADACREHDKPWGCPVGGPDQLQHRVDQGARFLCNFGEYGHLRDGLNSAIRQFE